MPRRSSGTSTPGGSLTSDKWTMSPTFNSPRSTANEFRQVFRQAGNFDVGDRMRNEHARHLAGRRFFLIEKVQRNADADRLVLVDALEIQMQQLRLERMALHVAQKHALRGAVEAQVENRGIKPLVLRCEPRGVVIELDARGIFAVAVNDSRHLARATQAAARTFAFVGTAFGRYFMFGSHCVCLD